MRQGLSYFHETIFSSLPVFYRRIDTALRNIGQPMLPIDHNLFQVCSSIIWGDMQSLPAIWTQRMLLSAGIWLSISNVAVVHSS